MSPIRRRHLGWLAVGTAVGLVMVAVVTSTVVSAVNSSLIRQSQVTNTKTLNKTEDTAALIRDCTDPGGECYKRNQETAGAAVADIGRVTILAAACAASLDDADLDVPTRAARIEKCLTDQLDADR